MPIQPGEPVYFLSLELQNVGAFGPEGVTINLSDGRGKYAQWTLILGENGVGKTTALECLLGLTPLPVDTAPFKGPGIHALSWRFNGKYERIVRASNNSAIKLASDIAPVKGDVRQGDFSRISFEIQRNAFTGEAEGFRVETPFVDPAHWPGSPVISYRAARDIDVENARFPEPPVGRQKADPDRSIQVFVPISVDDWLLQMHHSKVSQPSSKRPSDYDEVRSLLIDILPGVTGIDPKTPKERRDTVRMEYHTADGKVPYANLGLGYRSVMGLIGDLAYRLYSAYPDSPNPLSEPAVVLIDEIDLHLHPTWQRKLIGVLSERFPKVQFIATAHSPLMVQAAAGHNLVLLRRDPTTKQVVVENDVDGIANWRLDQIVTSELFGVPSAVRPQLDSEIERRDAILAKTELTDADRAEVRRIEAELGDVPLGTTEEAQRMNDLLRQVLGALESKPVE